MEQQNMPGGIPLFGEGMLGAQDEGQVLGELSFGSGDFSFDQEDASDGSLLGSLMGAGGLDLDLGGEAPASGDLNLDLTFEYDEIVLESMTAELNISSICQEYFQNINEVFDRMRPPKIRTDDEFTLSSADFKYLRQQELSTISKAMLAKAKEQLLLPEEQRLSGLDAAEEIFSEVTDATPFSVGAHYQEFIEMCARQYDNFFKRASATSVNIREKFADILDVKALTEAHYTFFINGFLWHKITLYLQDGDNKIVKDVSVNYYDNSSRQNFYNVAVIGPALGEYSDWRVQEGRSAVTVNNLTVGDLLECVEYTLSRVNMMRTLRLSEEEVSGLSIGELLRRYLLLELNEGLFDASGYHPSDVFPEFGNVSNTLFDRVNVQFTDDTRAEALYPQVMPLYVFLCAPFYAEGKGNLPAGATDSITHELLWYIAVILSMSNVKGSNVPAIIEYLRYLTPFMTSVRLNAPYVRPVMYYTPSVIKGARDRYELNFYIGGKYYSVEENGLLISVVGDSQQAYMVPGVKPVFDFDQTVKCMDKSVKAASPNCVVLPLYNLYTDMLKAISGAGSASKRGRLDMRTEYIYGPSLSWVVHRAYSSIRDVEEATVDERVSNKTTNPLLHTLLNYTNKFEPETQVAIPGVATIGDNQRVLYVRKGDTQDANFIGLVSGDRLITEEGTMGFDDSDGSMFMRYYQSDDSDGTTKVVGKDEFQLEEQVVKEASASQVLSAIDVLPTPVFDQALVSAKRYLRAVNQRVCKLNALEYEEELEEVRDIIAKDLAFVVPAVYLDTILALQVIWTHEDCVKKWGTLGRTNFESLLELSKIVLGTRSPLLGKKAWDDECMAVFDMARQASDATVFYICGLLDMYDVSVIALQGIASSHVKEGHYKDAYMAMLGIPGLHHRLRDLEERMVLLRVLDEVGTDISSTLRKRSPMLTAYTKITTRDTLDDIENSLKSGMRGGSKFNALPLTRKVLASDIGGSTPILKYFALEQNVHGIMATAICSEDEQEQELYKRLHHCLGLDAEGMPDVTQLDEATFLKASFAVTIGEACEQNRRELLSLIERGILADTSSRVDIRVIKAYDLLCSYGDDLFDIGYDSPECEDFSDVSAHSEDFFNYAGSFLVGYCPVDENYPEDLDTNAVPRLLVYRQNPDAFLFKFDLSKLSNYELHEIRECGVD